MSADTRDTREQAQPLTDDSPCPKCGELGIGRDEADVGVGIIYGPYGCPCGWSEWAEWDSSEGPAPVEAEHPGYYADPRGGLTSKLWLRKFEAVAALDDGEASP